MSKLCQCHRRGHNLCVCVTICSSVWSLDRKWSGILILIRKWIQTSKVIRILDYAKIINIPDVSSCWCKSSLAKISHHCMRNTWGHHKMPCLVMLRKTENVLDPHSESHKRQNLIAFRGSHLAHANQVWSSLIAVFVMDTYIQSMITTPALPVYRGLWLVMIV